MIDEKFLVELQNATSDCKKDIIKTTLKKLSTRNARRNYLKQLGIKFDEKRKLFSGGADNDLELKSLLCPITRMIFIEPVVAENGVTYEKSALISELRTSTNNLSFTTNKVMRHKVFKFKSEMGDNRKIQTFFRRHWNNRLAKKLGLGTYSTLSGWSSGTVGELYGIASRNDLVRNRLDIMLKEQSGQFSRQFKRKLLAILLFYIFIINPVKDDFMRYKNHRRAYDVLGVERGGERYFSGHQRSELKRAFRKQALKHHPDKGGDIEEFNKIQAAYDLLKKYSKP